MPSASGRIRTRDLPLRRRLLYPLSYGGKHAPLYPETDSLLLPGLAQINWAVFARNTLPQLRSRSSTPSTLNGEQPMMVVD